MPRSVLFAGLALLLAGTAAAGPYFVEVAGGYSWYDMGTVNEFVDTVNEEAGTRALDHLEGGPAFGVNLGYVSQGRIITAIGYERLVSTLDASAPGASLKIKSPGNIFRLRVGTSVGRLGRVVPFVMGGGGIVTTNGHVEVKYDTTDNRHDFRGTALMLEALAGVNILVGDRYAIMVAGGYRLADIDEPKWEGESFGGYGTFTGPGFDFTGAMVRVGLKIRLNWGDGGGAAPTEQTREKEATGWM